MDEESIYYHAVNSATRGSYHILKRLKAKHGSWKEAWNYGVSLARQAIDIEQEWKGLKERGLRLILFDDDNYPTLLKEIPFPPHGIYLRGKLQATSLTVAIVGTRRATSEGKELARAFASALGRAGATIVSGLAFGIDAAAHRGALEAHAPTLTILATGVDTIYPQSHAGLAAQILKQGGAIISEYPPQSPAFPYRFLERNRIVSGLAQGVLVVEAPKNSGALTTARFALEQNRDVYVIPGPIAHPNYQGSHRLIKEGALLVTEPEEILQALGLLPPQSQTHRPEFHTADEELIFTALEDAGESLSVDKIIELTNLNAQTVNQTLSFLVIRGIAKENADGYSI